MVGKHAPEDWGTVRSSGYGLMVVKTTDFATGEHKKTTSDKWRKAQRQPATSELRDSANDTKHTDALSGRQNRKQDAKNRREVMPIWSGWLQPPMPQPKATCAIEQGGGGQQTRGVRKRSLHRKTARLRGIFPRHAARFRPAHLERFFRGYHLPYTISRHRRHSAKYGKARKQRL